MPILPKEIAEFGSTPVVNLVHDCALTGVYDIELTGIAALRDCDSLDCHLVIYPYSRSVTAKDIKLMPFEEYVEDIISRHRSVYERIEEHGKYLFGFALVLALAAFFLVWQPVELLSLESIASLFGVYFVGKELWDDIERALQRISQRWRLRYIENYYQYQLGHSTTLTNYSSMARRQRYGQRSLLPERIDFIQQSNSQTVRLRFEASELRAFSEDTVHIASIHVFPAAAREFERGGFLFGVKLSLNRRRAPGEISLELFQSLAHGRLGCIGRDGAWCDGAVFYRTTSRWGKVKYFARHGLLDGIAMVATIQRGSENSADPALHTGN